MGSATNKPDQHRQYDAKYLNGIVRLDNADGVRILLGDYHTLINRQYQGDYAAVDILTDLRKAIELASLTARQRQAFDLVYGADLTQAEAGKRLGLAQNTVSEAVDRAVEAISEVYYYWAGHGEGYAVGGAPA
jgi:RNA polymerase sigma factor (sigma-70 family)